MGKSFYSLNSMLTDFGISWIWLHPVEINYFQIIRKVFAHNCPILEMSFSCTDGRVWLVAGRSGFDSVGHLLRLHRHYVRWRIPCQPIQCQNRHRSGYGSTRCLVLSESDSSRSWCVFVPGCAASKRVRWGKSFKILSRFPEKIVSIFITFQFN